jgi:hypothetical protein
LGSPITGFTMAGRISHPMPLASLSTV